MQSKHLIIMAYQQNTMVMFCAKQPSLDNQVQDREKYRLLEVNRLTRQYIVDVK